VRFRRWYRHLPFSSYCFFQAADGIRDRNVTGVQTCALPIYYLRSFTITITSDNSLLWITFILNYSLCGISTTTDCLLDCPLPTRSEERRVGKEGKAQRASHRSSREKKQVSNQLAIT